MVILDFALNHEGCSRFHDALSCLAKFGEYVTLVAHPTQLVLTALNPSKSAYVAFTFDQSSFFLKYDYSSSSNARSERFSCSMLNRALSSVFKGRLVDPRQRDTALEKCEVTVLDRPDRAECRLQIKMIYTHGVTKNYRLAYESVEPMHALFDKKNATNQWRIQARLLREYIEYFGPRTEQLDICAEDGRCTLISFTEKITRGKETLKQPLQTAVSIDCTDFQEFEASEGMHIIISVRDFKNMVIHAETLKTSVAAVYSQPGRPFQFHYNAKGIQCEFTLMTIGESLNSIAPIQAKSVEASIRNSTFVGANSQMPPPQRPATRVKTDTNKRLGSRTQESSFQSASSLDPESLFLPTDDDQQWEPIERQEEDEMLGWDASADNVEPTPKSIPSPFTDIFQNASLRGTVRDTVPVPVRREASGESADDVIAPTQRVSQFRGLFD